jgi:hypothetical protein
MRLYLTGQFTSDFCFGAFQNGKRNGEAVYIHKNKEKFVGPFKDGRLEGEGGINMYFLWI